MSEKPLDNYLRTERRMARLSQDDLAFLLGSEDGTTVSRYERGRRTPSLDTALAYEAILGIPVRDLFAGRFLVVEELIRARARTLAARMKKVPPILRALNKEIAICLEEVDRD
jgi:transcriptional regulator with XRE-family HTH domain